MIEENYELIDKAEKPNYAESLWDGSAFRFTKH
jgi:hypothetical protein